MSTQDTTRTRWARITEIVDGTLRLDDLEERSRFLDRACGDDSELRREVENLLQFEDDECDLLDRRRRYLGGIEGGQDGQLGPYRVEHLLGEGGMGAVFLVHDPELDRDVALKLLHRERLTPDLLRRFHDERRILARLDHPGIARILGGGTIEGVPYFTMEMVDGEPIDRYCDQKGLGECLETVLEVCDALTYAHRNLVVHRDLKPSNILVTDGRPKLLDFGIAKKIAPDAVKTRTGQQPLTLTYASPEQVRGQAVTTAVDIYSLGVLLYRLLCGEPPYLLDGDVLEDARRICEEEPPAPSRRTSRKGLRGDLDSIVLKALAKDSDDRYASIDDLADDLRRHLGGRPVRARRATMLYRSLKFLRRHRTRLAAAFLAAVLGTGFAVVRERNARQVASLAEESQRATEQARTAEDQADVLTTFLRNLLRSTSPDERRGGPLTAAEILRRGEERARRDLGDRPEMLAHQIEAIGLAHQMLGQLDIARPLLEESLRLRREVYGGDHPLVARGLNNLAALVHEIGDTALAEKLYRLALDMRLRLGETPVDVARIESNLALLLLQGGALAEAEELYRCLLATRREALGDHPDVSNSLRSLGTVLYLRGQFDEAEPLLREALEQRRNEDDVRPTRVASALSSLGRALHEQGRYEEAEEVLVEALEIRREVLGDDHLHVALTRKDLASLYFDAGKTEAAEVLWDQALAILRAVRPDGWEAADAESQLGGRLLAQGHRAEAEVYLRRSYATLRRLRGEEALQTVKARHRLAALSTTEDR